MGSSITIDKHGTPLEDWQQIQDSLQEIQFAGHSNTHIMVWKIFMDEIDHTVASIPVLLQQQGQGQANYANIFNSEEVYVVGLVKKEGYEGQGYVDGNLGVLLGGLGLNCSRKSLEIYVKKGIVDLEGRGKGRGISMEYFIYAFFGKRAKNNMKMAALCYCHKLDTILNNSQRIKIMTGGGVYRNKKLQLGSVLPLSRGKSTNEKPLTEYAYIHLVSQLMKPVSSVQQSDSQSMEDQPQPILSLFSLFSYVPRMPIPSMIQQQSKNKSISKEDRDSNISSSQISGMSGNTSQNPNKNTSKPKPQNPPQSSSFKTKPIHVPAIKPPMLKLALKPYEDVTYEQMDEQEKNNKFEIRATARHELKMQKFSNDCSMIIEGLYLSGEIIAKDEQILKKHKITDIINCAGDYCPNWHQHIKNDQNPSVPRYNYLTFFLKDSQNQNIECLFYRVIDFINNALSNRRNVLVHCIQGISRSVTFVIAYLIFTNGYDYKRAEAFVKERRGIACPNNGFMVECIQFYKRLHDKFGSLPQPRVFLVSHHCQETPEIVTARLIKQKLFESDGKKMLGLDQRGIYIVQTVDLLYLWVGSKCQDEKKMKKYWSYAQLYIKKLQQNEKGSMKVKAIHQGNEGKDFLSLWGLDQLPKEYQNPQYDRLFTEQKPTPKAGYLRKHYQRQQEQENTSQQYISKLYIFPDYENGLGVFQLEDLAGLSLLVKSDNMKLKVFVWRAHGWDGGEEGADQGFLENVIKANYASYGEEDIEIVEEEGGGEIEGLSEEFLSCFS